MLFALSCQGIALLGNAERGVLRHIPVKKGSMSRMAARQSLISTWRWAIGHVRRVLSESARASPARGRPRVHCHGGSSSDAGANFARAGSGQLERTGQIPGPHQRVSGGAEARESQSHQRKPDRWQWRWRWQQSQAKAQHPGAKGRRACTESCRAGAKGC